MTNPIRVLNTTASQEDPAALQLELWPGAADDGAARCAGIDPRIARASVSPAWWPVIAPIFDDDGLVVRVCEERDGQLMLDVVTRDQDEEDDFIAQTLQRIQHFVARTCGACGSSPAVRHRESLVGPTRIVCQRCWERLRSGESFLAIADDYWRVDGSRRSPPLRHTASSDGAPSPAVPPAGRECTTLPPDELRQVIASIRATMTADVVGQEQAVAELALLAGLHVGGGIPRGARALVIGPSGVGKTAMVLALRRALEVGNWNVPCVMVSAIDLQSPGWGGAPSLGDLLEDALRGAPPDSARARHALIIIDEIHHIGLEEGLTSNMRAKRDEVLSSLLAVVGYETVHLGEGTTEWSSREALVIAMGAFTGLLDATRQPTVDDLVRAGMPLELASRFETVIALKPLPERSLVDLLRRWVPLQSLRAVCERLGYTVHIHDEAFRHAARAVTLGWGGATPRTAGGWLVNALRAGCIKALEEPASTEIVIAPDSLMIPRTRTPRPPDDPPDGPGDWDATIILTPR